MSSDGQGASRMTVIKPFVGCLLTSFLLSWRIFLSFKSSNFKFLIWASILKQREKKNSNLVISKRILNITIQCDISYLFSKGDSEFVAHFRYPLRYHLIMAFA